MRKRVVIALVGFFFLLTHTVAIGHQPFVTDTVVYFQNNLACMNARIEFQDISQTLTFGKGKAEVAVPEYSVGLCTDTGNGQPCEGIDTSGSCIPQ